MRFGTKLLTLLAILCTIQTVHAQNVTKNIAYTTDPSGTQTGDLYQPSGSGPFPVVLFLHGGSWRSGNKSNYSKLAPDLAAKGYAGFSINYDLHAHAWPLAFDETEAAIRFLRSHAVEYHLDPAKIIVAGTSAGGQLAALAGLKPQGDGTAVAAVVELNGVYDLHANGGVIARYVGGKCDDIPTVCDAASPSEHIHAGSPPFFIGHGTDDRLVPYAAAQAFASALRKAGNTVVTFDATGGPHMYWEKKAFYAANCDALIKFLQAIVPSPLSAAP